MIIILLLHDCLIVEWPRACETHVFALQFPFVLGSRLERAYQKSAVLQCHWLYEYYERPIGDTINRNNNNCAQIGYANHKQQWNEGALAGSAIEKTPFCVLRTVFCHSTHTQTHTHTKRYSSSNRAWARTLFINVIILCIHKHNTEKSEDWNDVVRVCDAYVLCAPIQKKKKNSQFRVQFLVDGLSWKFRWGFFIYRHWRLCGRVIICHTLHSCAHHSRRRNHCIRLHSCARQPHGLTRFHFPEDLAKWREEWILDYSIGLCFKNARSSRCVCVRVCRQHVCTWKLIQSKDETQKTVLASRF